MIIVFGSIFMDVTFPVDAYPARDSIVSCGPVGFSPGGKGANAAVAAARTGAKVFMTGMVGNDPMGRQLKETLKLQGVMASGIGISDKPTGIVGVVAEPDGTNTQIASPGANRDAHHDQIPDEAMRAGNIIVMGLNLPRAQIRALLERTQGKGCRTILNVSPIKDCMAEMAVYADILVVNRDEMIALARQAGVADGDDPRLLCDAVARQMGKDVIVTLGGDGAYARRADGAFYDIPPFKVNAVVDTNGAGDCLLGFFAGFIHQGMEWEAALEHAVVASAMSCQKPGAMESYPYVDDIPEFPKNNLKYS